jgi:glycosyltransferase involved in cell wall biosynthesis
MRTSVIIPVFNGEDRLAEAVASVRPELGDGDEIVVVDDGSTDGTADLIASLGPDIVSLRRDNGGPAAARNSGLRCAVGDVIAFLDHDDIWAPQRQPRLVQALRDDDAVDIAMGRMKIIVDTQGPSPSADNPRYVANHRPWHLGALLIRRRVFDRVGTFDERLRNVEDADWYMRAREAGVLFQAIDHVTVYYRLHARNTSRDVGASTRFLLQVLKNALDRRRSP